MKSDTLELKLYESVQNRDLKRVYERQGMITSFSYKCGFALYLQDIRSSVSTAVIARYALGLLVANLND